MAESAGLVVGVIALASLFKDCVDLFLYIDSARHMNWDYRILETKLDVERTLLMQWAERVGLTRETPYDKRLDDEATHKAVLQILQQLRDLLNESDALQSRYGISPGPLKKKRGFFRAPDPESDGKDDVDSEFLTEHDDGFPRDVMASLSGPGIKSFTDQFQRMNVRDNIHSKDVPRLAKIRWSICDKDKFGKLVQDLSWFNSKLNDLIPSAEARSFTFTEEDKRRLGFEGLKLVRDATSDVHIVVAAAARGAIASNCRRRILDRLWFRLIDDRRLSIKPAFSNTLRWALQPGGISATEGDSLHDWFRSGEGIYWISGKAGSGKSTLMKHLYEEAKTVELLKDWAGSHTLIKANFFFWGLGSDEQKTLSGLTRAVLLSILQSRPDLISALLPGMWKDAQQSEDAVLEMPSKAEVDSAIDALHARMTMKSQPRLKFCIFIDGLDEYSGNFRDGIEFIQTLARISNIKVLISSRPIPACVDAFSRSKKLQLQDLTRSDIGEYVQATLGNHEHMKFLSDADEASAAGIRQDIVNKASGVFLWVILACRSVLEGLAACDFISELRNRVDDLPPELEDLFSHMLGKGDPRYQAQGAQLLRICYENQLSKATKQVTTLGLALADEKGFKTIHFVDCENIRRDDARRKCKIFEGRLRSRCCGLLEVQRSHQTGHRDYCWCNPRQGKHDIMLDSTVGFMHRTVYEFMRGKMDGGLQCLDVPARTFDAQLVLAWILLHMVRMSKRLFQNKQGQLDEAMRAFLAVSVRADEELKDGIIPIFRAFGQEIERLASQVEGATSFLSKYWDFKASETAPDFRDHLHISYLFAARAGLPHYIRTYTPDEDINVALRQVARVTRYVLEKTYLKSMDIGNLAQFELAEDYLVSIKTSLEANVLQRGATRIKRPRKQVEGPSIKRARVAKDTNLSRWVDDLLGEDLKVK